MGDLFGAIADVIGTGAKVGLGEQAAGEFNDPKAAYQSLNPNLAMPDVAQGDPATQMQQRLLLQSAMDRMRAGGLNAADLGRLGAIRSQTGQMARAGQAAAMSDAQQRGALQGNSGILGSTVAGQAAAARRSPVRHGDPGVMMIIEENAPWHWKNCRPKSTCW